MFDNVEKKLLKKLAEGAFDGIVGDVLDMDSGSTTWAEIRNGIPAQYKQGPGGKIFNGKENEKFEGAVRKIRTYKTDEDKIGFLRNRGWLLDDDDAKKYSGMFKKKR